VHQDQSCLLRRGYWYWMTLWRQIPKVRHRIHKSLPRIFIMIRKKLEVLRWGVVSPPPNPQARGPPPVGCPRLLIQYIRSYRPYLEDVSSIRNLRTRHAVVKGDPFNVGDYWDECHGPEHVLGSSCRQFFFVF
jgi:hypothetical protein